MGAIFCCPHKQRHTMSPPGPMNENECNARYERLYKEFMKNSKNKSKKSRERPIS